MFKAPYSTLRVWVFNNWVVITFNSNAYLTSIDLKCQSAFKHIGIF